MPRANDPLRIAEIETRLGGRIGITLCPGKKQVRALGGRHDRDLKTDLDAIARWNAAAVVTLVEEHELADLRVANLGEEVARRFMEWHHFPIADGSVPDAAFEVAWPERGLRVRQLLETGSRILIHCKGGLGRAGMVAARLLVESGEDPAAAVTKVRAARPGAIETREQELWVRLGRQPARQKIDHSEATTTDRATGALIGLAVGDAVGTTLEFQDKPAHPLIQDMIGGGPFSLRVGQWTDDTAMALALADSLLAHPALDPLDLMSRFLGWHDNGSYSCTGSCFDIGIQTRSALERFRGDGWPLAGSIEPRHSGNGALMRLAPVAIRHWSNRMELRRIAELQTRTTHGSPETVEASVTFAEMLADAISGHSLASVLSSPAASRIKPFQGVHRNEISGSGYVVQSLQAAVWSVARTSSFRSAILLAANLGEDADTTAAVAGQLAGAVYGRAGIPPEWLRQLAWGERIERTAEQLFVQGSRQE